jgi:hypothetical protein
MFRIEVYGKIKLLTLLEMEGGGFIESYAGVRRVMIQGGLRFLDSVSPGADSSVVKASLI